MQNAFRSLLIAVLCGLSVLSSTASDSIHENLHALFSSACLADDRAVDVNPGAQGLHSLTTACPIQLIVQASLGHSLILPASISTFLQTPFATTVVFNFESFAFQNWNTSWTFTRGPPRLLA